MGFPKIDIRFQNGQLGQVLPFPDGLCGFVASAVAVAGKFQLNTAYQVKSMVDVAALGIIPDVNNYKLYKTLLEFYEQAGEGTEIWLMGFAKTTKVSDWYTLDVDTGKAPVHKLLDAANGQIRCIVNAFSPDGDYELEIEDALDIDVWTAISKANILTVAYAESKYAPAIVLFEGYGFTGVKEDLPDTAEMNFGRCQVLIGDSEKRTGPTASKGAAIGALAGKYASIQVHVNIGKVRDGALSLQEAYILDTPAELYDCEALHDKGFVTFRMHTTKAGYFFSDDPMLCPVADDYHYGTRRRTIDKAYRLGYQALLDFLLDDNTVNSNGTIDPFYAKTVENAVESLIFSQMTANGELSFDSTNPKDRGVICQVDLTHNVTSTSKLKLAKFQVKTKGTNRFIDVPLGFVPVTSNN